ncbi:hypothetical protein NM208_g8823 [Fusarium decemcellulare]|uniref:Uncharacterized protein n=1 Tax=Fusarium decemcellulare TaxID=57161 RepID=A0ACC1S3X6_9HYPO|nr:hypothetical protein NM208_g8823 [Fusarium decemcellulare]
MAFPVTKMVEVASQHFMCESSFYPGERFSEPFPGLQPSLEERRRYMKAFLPWMIWTEDFGRDYITVRKHAESLTATRFIERGITEVRDSIFEWQTDRLLWQLWFRKLPKERCPLWPFMKTPKKPTGEGPSQRFADLLEEHRRNGTLFPNREPTQG